MQFNLEDIENFLKFLISFPNSFLQGPLLQSLQSVIIPGMRRHLMNVN